MKQNGVYLRFEAETNKQCQRENRDRELRGLDGFVTRLLEGPLKGKISRVVQGTDQSGYVKVDAAEGDK